MFYALGFVSAGLLALACLPAVWKRAVRLTHRRLKQLVPLSAEEIVAERDQLRAGFAVEQRRLEQKLDRSEATRGTLLGEAGRRDTRQLALEDELRRAMDRAAGLAHDLQAAERAIHGLEAEAGTTAIVLNDLTGLSEQRFWEVETAQARVRALESGIDEGRATVAALQTRILGLESRLGDVNQALGITKAELARTVEAVTRAKAERDAARRSATSGADTARRDLDLPREAAPAIVDAPGVAEDAHRLAAERDALATELAATRDAHAASLETMADLRTKLAAAVPKAEDGPGQPMPTAADIALVRDQLRALSEEIWRTSRAEVGSDPEPAAAAR